MLELISNDNHKYLLSFDIIMSKPNNLLTGAIGFNKLDYVKFNDKLHNSIQINVLYKVFNNEYITLSEYIDNINMFDYYLIDNKFILISDIIKQDNHFVNDLCLDENIIICINDNIFNNMKHLFKNNDNYIPFRLILSQTTIYNQINYSNYKCKFRPVFFSVSDYNNIYLYDPMPVDNSDQIKDLKHIKFNKSKNIFNFNNYNDSINSDMLIKKLNMCYWSHDLNSKHIDNLTNIYENKYFSIDNENNKVISNTTQSRNIMNRLNNMAFYDIIIDKFNKYENILPIYNGARGIYMATQYYKLITINGFIKLS